MVVHVSYSDSGTCWFSMEAAVAAHAPEYLANLAFAHAARMRPIDRLLVEFVPFNAETLFPRAVKGAPSPLAVHMFLVDCDDMELYKSTVKKKMTDWFSVVGTKRAQETMVVYLTPPETLRKNTRPFGFGSVFDKMKSDFSSHKSHFIQLKTTQVGDHAVWSEFFAKLRELIMSSFDQKLIQYEEDIRRLDSQRLLPGWNYCQFFILKDGAACTSEYLNITEDALLQYDELEAAFFQNLQEQGAPWFQSFGGTDTNDDSADILDISRKPYYDMILQNTVTIFDFRVYLFARQISLLFAGATQSNAIAEAADRGKKFIDSFARTLREYEAGLNPLFRESWIYSACLCIVRHCDEQLAKIPNPSIPSQYETIKAELIYQSRIQLDMLGTALGFLPFSVHSIQQGFAKPLEATREAVASVSNVELRRSLTNDEEFDKLYMSLSEKSVKCFEHTNRRRSEFLVKSDMAILKFHRKQFEQAAVALENVLASHTEAWREIKHELLEKTVMCYKETKNDPSMFDCCWRLLDNASGSETITNISEIIDLMHSKLGTFKSSTSRAFNESAIFKTCISRFINRVANTDSHILEVKIENPLQKSIVVDTITAFLEGAGNHSAVCQSTSVKLDPGCNIKISTGGTYYVLRLSLQIANVEFIYNKPKSLQKNVTFSVEEQIPVFQLTATLLPAEENSARKFNRVLQVVLHDAFKPVHSIMVRATPFAFASIPLLSQSGVAVTIRKPTGQIVWEKEVEVLDMQVRIPSMDVSDAVTFSLPMLVFGDDIVDVDIAFDVQYSSLDNRSHVIRKIRKVRVHPMVTIDHSFIPHDSKTILRLFVKGQSVVPLRLGEAQLEGFSGLKITSTSSTKDMLLFKDQTVSLVYLLEPAEKGAIDMNFCRSCILAESVTKSGEIRLKYHRSVDEIAHSLSQTLTKFLAVRSREQYLSFLSSKIQELLFIDPNKYCLEGRAPLPLLDPFVIRQAMASEEADVIEEVTSLFADFMAEVGSVNMTSAKEVGYVGYENIHEVCHAFDKTEFDVVLSAEILPSIQESIHTGDLLPCKLVINSSVWNLLDEGIDVNYEIVINERNWLLAGQNKRKFRLQVLFNTF
ncbi:hypothetical protein HDU83_007540 [Entophlyctis luteolus]|nr:hypothetical protein HDU83_007540 [Entophlyctis luteolus]